MRLRSGQRCKLEAVAKDETSVERVHSGLVVYSMASAK